MPHYPVRLAHHHHGGATRIAVRHHGGAVMLANHRHHHHRAHQHTHIVHGGDISNAIATRIQSIKIPKTKRKYISL